LETNTINDAGAVYIFEYSGNLSVNEESIVNSIVSYPNPVTDILNVSANNSFLKYSITSISGQIIEKSDLNETHTIDVSALSNGLYFITLHTDETQSTTLKFVK